MTIAHTSSAGPPNLPPQAHGHPLSPLALALHVCLFKVVNAHLILALQEKLPIGHIPVVPAGMLIVGLLGQSAQHYQCQYRVLKGALSVQSAAVICVSVL